MRGWYKNGTYKRRARGAGSLEIDVLYAFRPKPLYQPCDSLHYRSVLLHAPSRRHAGSARGGTLGRLESQRKAPRCPQSPRLWRDAYLGTQATKQGARVGGSALCSVESFWSALCSKRRTKKTAAVKAGLLLRRRDRHTAQARTLSGVVCASAIRSCIVGRMMVCQRQTESVARLAIVASLVGKGRVKSQDVAVFLW